MAQVFLRLRMNDDQLRKNTRLIPSPGEDQRQVRWYLVRCVRFDPFATRTGAARHFRRSSYRPRFNRLR